MLFRICVASIAVLIMLSGAVEAFDGNRKGFILGGGMGIGPSTKLKIINEYDKNELGFAVNIMVGYAWNNKNILCFEYNANHFWPPAFGSDTALSVFSSPVWYHYYGDEGKSLFSAVGWGRHGLAIEKNGSARGLGFLFGGGYEFKKHFQVGIYYSGGNVTTNCCSGTSSDGSYYVDRLNVILTLVLY